MTTSSMFTYDDLAAMLGTSKDSLYSVSSNHPEPFTPDVIDGVTYYFTQASVDRIRAWWDENSRFRVKPPPADEKAYSTKELYSVFGIPFTTVQHYRRRYKMLYPDFYSANPSGRGRPVAMYLESTIKEFQEWMAAGRPEPDYARVKSVTLRQGRFDAIVTFGDGTTVGLLDDEWRISPPPDTQEMAGLYTRIASRWVEHERYAERWTANRKGAK